MGLKLKRHVSICLVGAVLAAGCGGATPTISSEGLSKSDDMAELYGLLVDYVSATKRGPSKVGDLARFSQLYPRAYNSVKEGDTVVIWDTAPQLGDDGTAIIAYDAKAPTEGGPVLLQNGKVKTMTAAEFAAAPKADKK